MGRRSFGYRALDKSGAQRAGVVEAADLAAAAEQVRAKGLFPLSLCEGNTPPRKIVPDARPTVREGRPEMNVSLALLQAIKDGATEVVFTCGSISVELECRVGHASHRMLPLSGDMTDQVLDALRQMSRAPDLGRGTVRAQSTVDLRRALPGGPHKPHEVTLEFRSRADTPRRVAVRILDAPPTA